MMNRRSLMIAATAVAAVPRPSLAQDAAGADARRAEVLAVRRFAEQTHPRGREAAADADWAARWDQAAANAGASDGVYAVGLLRALAWFGDGHTSVPVHARGGQPPEPLAQGPWARRLPLRVGMFDDGAWVTEAAQTELLGKRLTALNGRPVDEVIRAHAAAWTGSDAWTHAWAGEVITEPGFLQGFGVIGDSWDAPVMIGVEGAEVRMTPGARDAALSVLPREKSEVEVWAAEAGVGNFMRRIGAGETLYVSLDQMTDIGERKFLDVVREVIAALPEPALKRVVIDLRRNGGGNNGFGEPLRKALERSRFNRPGGLYVLAGPRTFSAAQNLATRLERETYALFAGGPTGGAPNHYGDARMMTGEATGLPVFVSTLPWFDSAPQDQRRWILPDIASTSTFEDWRAGRDPALAAVLADTTSSEGNDVTLLRTFPYRRPSQSVEWKPFWRT